MSQQANNNYFTITGIALLSLVWGSSFFLMKLAMEGDGYSSLEVGMLRMIIAGVCLTPVFLIRRKHILQQKNILPLFIVGIIGSAFPSYLFPLAEEHISSGQAGILNASVPFFVLIIGALFFKQTITKKKVLGLLIGLVGVFLVILSTGESLSFNGKDMLYSSFVLLACACYGVSVNTVSAKLGHMHPVDITTGAFSFVFIPELILASFVENSYTKFFNPELLQNTIALVILSLVGTVLALFLYNKIIAVAGALIASIVTYFIPIVAVILGALVLKEQVNQWFLLGFLLILSGVLVLRKK